MFVAPLLQAYSNNITLFICYLKNIFLIECVKVCEVFFQCKIQAAL